MAPVSAPPLAYTQPGPVSSHAPGAAPPGALPAAASEAAARDGAGAFNSNGVSKYLQRFSLNKNMGDRKPAKEPEPRTTCHLFKWSMRNEARRLRTFRQWPADSPVSPQDLARAGFYYLGPGDEVRCFCCSGILKDWVPGDCPVAEHRKYFPSCKFIRGEPVGNQGMPPHPQEAADAVDGQVVSVLQGVNSEEAAVPRAPENPAMVAEETRLLTFQGCPLYPNVNYQALARAGFFYTGQRGILKCFHCNGSVRICQLEADPWREHAKRFPRCEFLLQSRGREFVSSVQESLSNTQVPVS
ncbi:baculoviral IAP repeat-containing protein 7 [Melopsittacus undulatus]|uniref:baculoviral IAP repeat-containing protein 7 n=1 Tax=Melopsittacus undulatus TaxID=13146 RepID=UPI00146ECCA6|nr:baculoviral IAP repeat-containing protein 7 [Melopsittacus undulatus]